MGHSGEVFSLRISHELRAALHERAANHGIGASAWARQILETALTEPATEEMTFTRGWQEGYAAAAKYVLQAVLGAFAQVQRDFASGEILAETEAVLDEFDQGQR